MLGVREPNFHTIPYRSMPRHEISAALFWGQPSWLRILGEETPSRDKFAGDTEMQWRSGGNCRSHVFQASPGKTLPTDVFRLCVRHMPWRWWICRRNCGSIPFAAWGIQRVRLYPVRTVCADAKQAFVFPCCRTFAIWIPSFTARLSKNQTVASVAFQNFPAMGHLEKSKSLRLLLWPLWRLVSEVFQRDNCH